jgi:pilus assembly protein FimV
LTPHLFLGIILYSTRGKMMVGDKDRIFELAQKITQSKNLKKTIKEYQKILERNPDDYKTVLKLGDLYLRRGNLDKAIKEYFKTAEFYVKEDLDLKAIAMFRRILVLNPGMLDAYYKLADLYNKRGLYGDAKVQFQKILEIDPKNKKAHEGLQWISNKAVKAAAEAPKKKVIEDSTREKDPVWNSILQELQRQLSAQLRNDDFQTHYHLGIAFKEMGLLQKAVEEFKISLGNSDLEFNGFLMLGICYREMGNHREAIENLKKGLRVKPLTNKQYEDIYYQLGLTCEECGQVHDALDAFNKVAEIKGEKASTELHLKVQKLKEQAPSR